MPEFNKYDRKLNMLNCKVLESKNEPENLDSALYRMIDKKLLQTKYRLRNWLMSRKRYWG